METPAPGHTAGALSELDAQREQFKQDLVALCDRAQSYLLPRATNRRTPKVEDLLEVLTSFSFYLDKMEALAVLRIALGRAGDEVVSPALIERLEISEEADRLKLVFADLMHVKRDAQGAPLWHLHYHQLGNTLTWW